MEEKRQQNAKWFTCYGAYGSYSCNTGQTCCNNDCCWPAGALFYNFWFVWMIVGIIVLVLILVGLCWCCGCISVNNTSMNTARTDTTRTNTGPIRNTAVYAARRPANIRGGSGSRVNYYSSDTPHSDGTATLLFTDIHDITDHRSNSPPRSRHLLGHCVPASHCPASDGGVTSDAPPSYFDVIHCSGGDHTKAPSAPECGYQEPSCSDWNSGHQDTSCSDWNTCSEPTASSCDDGGCTTSCD